MIEKYPYTDFNEYNLDWVIRKVKEIDSAMTDYEALHSISFGGDWSIEKQYQSWTIVSDPVTHDAYLSLKPVPNNIQLSNEEYWLKISDYTTGLMAVNARIDLIDADLTDNINPAIASLESSVGNITNTEIPALQAADENLQTQIDHLADRKIIIFGDSYFEDNPVSGDTNFRYYLTSCLGNVTNIEFELNSQGGEGFGWTGSSAGYNFLYDVQNYVSGFDSESVTDIFFVGGYNDRNFSRTDIYSGMSSCFSLCKTKYPNAKISVGHFGWSGTLNSANRELIVNYSLPAWKECVQYGAGYMTNAEFTLHNYDLFYDADRFHPNANGHKQLAIQITNYILTGSCNVHYRYMTIPFNQGNVDAEYTETAYTVGFKLDNDLVTVYFPDVNIIYDSSNTGFNMSVDSYTSMFQLASMTTGYKGYALGMYDESLHVGQVFPIRGYIQTENSTFRTLSECQCVLAGGFIKVRPFGIKSDRSGYETYTGVYAIHLIGGAYTVPTLSC